jgi:proton glutamate symport protein
MLKKLPLWAKIFIGMGLGILWGLVSVWTGWEDFTTNWVKPWGTIFLKLLKLIAVPLIFVSLVKGISSLTDITKLSRIGYKTIVIYIITTVFATTVGLAMVNIFKPGDVFPDERQDQYREKFGGQVEIRQESAKEFEKQSPLHFFEEMIPENFFYAAGDNSKMLQIIFFAILFSIALVLVPGEKTQVVKDFFDGLNDVILKIVDMIMRFAPIGVFALMAALVVDFSGDADIFTALGMYMLTVILGLFLLILGFYPLLIRVFAGIRISTFLKGILPAQLVAFTTSSSAATLPVTMKQVTNELGVSKPIANFCAAGGGDHQHGWDQLLPGHSRSIYCAGFRDRSYPDSAAHHRPDSHPGLHWIAGHSQREHCDADHCPQLCGTSGGRTGPDPGVDRPLDMLRTVVNITGDSTVSSIVARTEGELEQNP